MKTDWKKIPKNSKVIILEGDVSPYHEEIDEHTPDFVARGYINDEYCRIGLTEYVSGPGDCFSWTEPTHFAPAEQITMGDLEEVDE